MDSTRKCNRVIEETGGTVRIGPVHYKTLEEIEKIWQSIGEKCERVNNNDEREEQSFHDLLPRGKEDFRIQQLDERPETCEVI